MEDPSLDIIGFQVDFDDPEEGFFLFNHTCETTLAIRVGEFEDLYEGPIFSERLMNTDECPQYCLHKSELRPCPIKCECAFVREIIQIIKHWPKK